MSPGGCEGAVADQPRDAPSGRINELIPAATDERRVAILRDACGEASEFLECYCNCGEVKGRVAKKLRQALAMTETHARPDRV